MNRKGIVSIGLLLLGSLGFFHSPAEAITINVPAGGNLQTALNSANGGDVIVLQAGATYSTTSGFRLPNKGALSSYITIQSSRLSELPASGYRVNPTHAALMPKIVVTANGEAAIIANYAANHYRLLGLEVAVAPNIWSYRLIEFGVGDETVSSQWPHHITVDRCYVHGFMPGVYPGTKRGIQLNGANLDVLNSYISGIAHKDNDAQGIGGWSGPGPYRIINNYIEGSGENVLFGGDVPLIANTIPSDIEFRNNYLFKPLSWKEGHPSYAGFNWVNKNLFELKNARRVTIDGNIFENSWRDGQSGFAIVFTPRSQKGVAPWSGVTDVTFTRNIVRNAGSGFQFLASDESGPNAGLHRITVRNNLVYNINPTEFGGDGRLFQMLGNGTPGTDWIVEHNTALHEGPGNAMLVAEAPSGTRVANRLTFSNNLATHGTYGVKASGQGTAALDQYFTAWSFLHNVLIAGGRASIYPSTTLFAADIAAVRFMNALADDYRLRSDSPYKAAATDGTDIGANVPEILAVTCGVRTGVPSSTCASVPIDPPGIRPSITAQPVNRSVAVGQTATFSISATGTAPLAYQWQMRTSATASFANISGAKSATYTTPAVVLADNGKQFRCVVTNSLGSATSNAVTLTVTAMVVAPSITTQPASRSVTAGGSAIFTVSAAGSAPLSYQWQRAAPGSSTFGAITGATAASYTVASVTTAMSGSRYRVVVRNSAGSATSNPATLTVTSSGSAPVISVQPANTTAYAGLNATFTASATGTGPIAYQWQSRSSAAGTFANIAGATSKSFTLFGVSMTENGSQYRCVISNIIGTATTNAVTLTVLSPATGAPHVTVLVPIQGSTINGDIVTAAFFSVGDLSTVDHIVLQLDDAGPVRAASLSGTYNFFNVGIGPHTLRVHLEQADGTLISGTSVMVTFSTQDGLLTGALPTPILSLPSYIPVNGDISVQYAPGYGSVGFAWTIEPRDGSSAALRQTSGVLGNPSYASFQTASNVANLNSYALVPGLYRISVQAFNSSGQVSAPAQQDVTLVNADFSNIRAYPNPWRIDRHRSLPITFSGLPLGSNVKIFTVSGHHVRTLTPSATTVTWDLRNSQGDDVASGLYLYLIQVDDQTAKGKLAIIK